MPFVNPSRNQAFLEPVIDQEFWQMPALPSLFTRPLGLEGWTALEPVLLAALASGDPMLLIGPHGCAKSFLLERLAEALAMEYRFYNASLLNYDDLVGIPMPNEDRTALRYLTTPSAIWNAEVVFIDEINRTRPDLQNKLFPIIHDRRVQGIDLERLRYRWAAMNPSSASAGERLDVYLGAEPLDPALADRFAYLIRVPVWRSLEEEEKRRVLCDQYAGRHSLSVDLARLVATASGWLTRLQSDPPRPLTDYVIWAVTHVDRITSQCSARRATMLHRNAMAIHAARLALYAEAYPEIRPGELDWNTTACLTLQNSLPQVVGEDALDPVDILAAHRQTWALCSLDDDNPRRRLLRIDDPLERCLVAVGLGDRLDLMELGKMVTDAVAGQPTREETTLTALALYGQLRETRNLPPAVFETLAPLISGIVTPGLARCEVQCPRQVAESVAVVCAELDAATDSPRQTRDRYTYNLLQWLQLIGYPAMAPERVREQFEALWDRLEIELSAGAKEVEHG